MLGWPIELKSTAGMASDSARASGRRFGNEGVGMRRFDSQWTFLLSVFTVLALAAT